MWRIIVLAVLLPILLLTQSVMVQHIHVLDLASEQHQVPHIHWFDQHETCGKVAENLADDGACQDESQDSEHEEAIYDLCYLVNSGQRLSLCDIKAGMDFLLQIDIKLESHNFPMTATRVVLHPTRSMRHLLKSPDLIRNSLLRV